MDKKMIDGMKYENQKGEIRPIKVVYGWRIAIKPYIDVTEDWIDDLRNIKQGKGVMPDHWRTMRIIIKDLSVVADDGTLKTVIFPLHAVKYDSALKEIIWANEEGDLFVLDL